jgi:hypothetical protein
VVVVRFLRMMILMMITQADGEDEAVKLEDVAKLH